MQQSVETIPAQFSDIPEFYLIAVQNNDEGRCVIESANDGFADLLGVRPDDMEGNDLFKWFADSTKDAVTDMLEYEAQGQDLYDTLSKQRVIKWKSVEGKETSFPVNIHRIESRSSHMRFKLSVPDERSTRAKEQLNSFLKDYFEGRIVRDEQTGLANREASLAFFDSLKHFVDAHGVQVTFATMRIDRFDKSLKLYGREACLELIKHVAKGCQRALGAEDVVTRISSQQLALFMFNVSRESARVILNRLRWLIRSHRIPFGGKPDFAVTVSFAFNTLEPDGGQNTAEICEQALIDLSEDERNRLIELAA